MTFFYSKFDVKKMARRMQKQIICSLSTSNNKNKDIIFYWLTFCLRWEIVIGKNMCSLQVRDLLTQSKMAAAVWRQTFRHALSVVIKGSSLSRLYSSKSLFLVYLDGTMVTGLLNGSSYLGMVGVPSPMVFSRHWTVGFFFRCKEIIVKP